MIGIRNTKKIILSICFQVIIFSSILPVIPIFAQNSSESASKNEKDEKQKAREIILYGIDTEITDLLKKLESEKDRTHDDLLLKLMESSRSEKIIKGLFSYFSSYENKGVVGKALKIIENRDMWKTETVKAALSYLIKLKVKETLPIAAEIIKSREKDYLGQAIRIYGLTGGPEEAVKLIELFDSDEWSEDLRMEIILALGEIKSSEAVDRLVKLVKETDTGKMQRIKICEALALIGDPGTLSTLLKIAYDEDPNVRAAAVEALGSFTGSDMEAVILESLKDSYPKTRLAAIKVSVKRKLIQAVEILEYKASSDPDRKVREESLKALSEISNKSFDFLIEYVSEKKNDPEFRSLVFALLVKKDISASKKLHEILETAIADKNQNFFKFLAKSITSIEGKEAIPFIKILLVHSDHTIRLGALDWIKRNQVNDLYSTVKDMATNDKAEIVRKKASSIVENL